MAGRREYKQELVDWIKQFYGEGKLFPSANDLSTRATPNPNTIAVLEKNGNATAEVLVAIARTVGDDPLRVLVMSGLLREAEVDRGLAPDEERLLANYRLLPVARRQTLLAVLEGFRWPSNQEQISRQVAESRAEYQANSESR